MLHSISHGWGRFEVDYGDLVATNDYARDGQALTYEITMGELTGNTATVGFEWRHLSGQSCAIVAGGGRLGGRSHR
ncbi:MoaF-related domain-containing protein [Pseudaminobacter salicylatoxidans]|uniref:MoaF-related domain-containing protein n=1 Tax=Pseudaminobacter salicylatoxidans TaxID=93369 RepID=UPI003CC76812